jgi:hypothetical protein
MNKIEIGEIDDRQKLVERFIREEFHADVTVWIQPRGYVHVFFKTPAIVRIAEDWAARARGRAQGDQSAAA